ncbi:MAG: tetratricopeptide repeat protein [Pseudomonadota bacterium]
MVLALILPAPAFAGPPVVLAQFFEHFDDDMGGTEPPMDSPGLNDPILDGLDLKGLNDDGLDAVPDGQSQLPGSAAAPGLDEADDGFEMGGVPPALDPADRPALLSGLYDKLAEAKSPGEAETLTSSIEELWAISGSDTVDLLMSRAAQFANGADVELSLSVLDALVDIAPEQAEAWYMRARVNVLAGNPERALADLRRTLNLDPRHYRAIADLGLVLEQLGAKKEALKAYRQALEVNPYMDDAQAGVDALAREVEGQDI